MRKALVVVVVLSGTAGLPSAVGEAAGHAVRPVTGGWEVSGGSMAVRVENTAGRIVSIRVRGKPVTAGRGGLLQLRDIQLSPGIHRLTVTPSK